MTPRLEDLSIPTAENRLQKKSPTLVGKIKEIDTKYQQKKSTLKQDVKGRLDGLFTDINKKVKDIEIAEEVGGDAAPLIQIINQECIEAEKLIDAPDSLDSIPTQVPPPAFIPGNPLLAEMTQKEKNMKPEELKELPGRLLDEVRAYKIRLASDKKKLQEQVKKIHDDIEHKAKKDSSQLDELAFVEKLYTDMEKGLSDIEIKIKNINDLEIGGITFQNQSQKLLYLDHLMAETIRKTPPGEGKDNKVAWTLGGLAPTTLAAAGIVVGCIWLLAKVGGKTSTLLINVIRSVKGMNPVGKWNEVFSPSSNPALVAMPQAERKQLIKELQIFGELSGADASVLERLENMAKSKRKMLNWSDKKFMKDLEKMSKGGLFRKPGGDFLNNKNINDVLTRMRANPNGIVDWNSQELKDLVEGALKKIEEDAVAGMLTRTEANQKILAIRGFEKKTKPSKALTNDQFMDSFEAILDGRRPKIELEDTIMPKSRPKVKAAKNANKPMAPIPENSPAGKQIQSMFDDTVDYIKLNHGNNTSMLLDLDDVRSKTLEGKFSQGTDIKVEFAKKMSLPTGTTFDAAINNMKLTMGKLGGVTYSPVNLSHRTTLDSYQKEMDELEGLYKNKTNIEAQIAQKSEALRAYTISKRGTVTAASDTYVDSLEKEIIRLSGVIPTSAPLGTLPAVGTLAHIEGQIASKVNTIERASISHNGNRVALRAFEIAGEKNPAKITELKLARMAEVATELENRSIIKVLRKSI